MSAVRMHKRGQASEHVTPHFINEDGGRWCRCSCPICSSPSRMCRCPDCVCGRTDEGPTSLARLLP